MVSKWPKLLWIYIVAILTPSFLCERVWKYDLHMPGVTTTQLDAYVCAYFSIPPTNKTQFITEILPKVSGSIAHHVILRGCTSTLSSFGKIEKCGVCGTLLYSWAMNASFLRFPLGVGVPCGANFEIKGFELEVHYLGIVHQPDFSGLTLVLTDQVQPRFAGVFVLLRNEAYIPPGKKQVNVDVSCRIATNLPITLMAMRTHTHALGRSIVGYRLIRGRESVQFLGRGNPQWPQAFYPLRQLGSKYDSVEVAEDDILFARCIYDSRNRSSATLIGPTSHDEMCNLYLLYHSSPSNTIENEMKICMTDEFEYKWDQISHSISDYAATDSPPNPDVINNPFLNVRFISSPKPMFFDEVSLGQVVSVATVLQNKDDSSHHEVIILHRGPNQWDLYSFDNRFVYRDLSNLLTIDPIVHIDSHTGKIMKQWGRNLFILPHSISVEYHKDGHSAKSVWVTDVALHQVFKFDWGNFKTPSFILGTAGQPGNTETQFCQPTDVAVSSSGDVFVSDGYCNSRIVKFSSNGTYLTEWSATGRSFGNYRTLYGQVRQSTNHPWSYRNRETGFLPVSRVQRDSRLNSAQFKLIHSLTIIPTEQGSLEQVCAADRENAAILCYTLDGQLIARYVDSALSPSVYAIEYDRRHKVLIGITGRKTISEYDVSIDNEIWSSSIGFFLNPFKPKSIDEITRNDPYSFSSQRVSSLVGFFAATHIKSPHDLTLATDSKRIYVSDCKSNKLFFMNLEHDTEFESVLQPPHGILGHLRVLHLSNISASQWIGIIMIILLLIFVSLIVCIRLCWCGRRIPGPLLIRRSSSKVSEFHVEPLNKKGDRYFSRVASSNKAARKAGFRPLIQNNGDPNYFGDEDDEIDDEEEEVANFSERRAGEHLKIVTHPDPVVGLIGVSQPMKSARLLDLAKSNESAKRSVNFRLDEQNNSNSLA